MRRQLRRLSSGGTKNEFRYKGFPHEVIEKLEYYVYILKDPLKKGRIFYVGKGKGNRVFDHASAAINNPRKTDKLDTIRGIMKSGKSVQYEIMRHGMLEDQAIEVEAALIDYIGLESLSNRAAGYKMQTRGRMTIPDILGLYKSRIITVKVSAILIIVNKLFRRNMSPDDLYEITRGNWVIGPRREIVKYALAIYHGIVREVYRIQGWEEAEARNPTQKRRRRWRFRGCVAVEFQSYVGGKVNYHFKKGARGPIRYINYPSGH